MDTSYRDKLVLSIKDHPQNSEGRDITDIGPDHGSPLGIPGQKEWPAHSLNFVQPKIGQIIWEDMSEVLGVGSF